MGDNHQQTSSSPPREKWWRLRRSRRGQAPQQPSSSTPKRKGGLLLAAAFVICVLSFAATLYAGACGSRSQTVAAGTIFVSLTLTLFVMDRLWKIRHIEVAHWVLLNHTTPLLFVLLPPIFFALLFGGVPPAPLPSPLCAELPRDRDQGAVTAAGAMAISAPMPKNTEHQTPLPAPASNNPATSIAGIFFPSYYSLLVLVAVLFITLQTDIAVAIERVDPSRPPSRIELQTWRLASSLCVLAALFAALLYVLPYVSDIKMELTDTMKAWLYGIAAALVFMGPGAAIWLKLKLTNSTLAHSSPSNRPQGAPPPHSNYSNYQKAPVGQV